jgi:hypothetical protein
MNTFGVDHFDQIFFYCLVQECKVATLKQILDSPKFWNFHKPFPKPKPRPPMSAKPYLEHIYAEFWSKFNSQETFACHVCGAHRIELGYNHSTNYVPPPFSLSMAHL